MAHELIQSTPDIRGYKYSMPEWTRTLEEQLYVAVKLLKHVTKVPDEEDVINL